VDPESGEAHLLRHQIEELANSRNTRHVVGVLMAPDTGFRLMYACIDLFLRDHRPEAVTRRPEAFRSESSVY
jgi:hypothetical protein